MALTCTPIGIVHSCFKEKFGIPRQPGLVPAARAQLELLPPYDDPQALAGLEQCSPIWLQFVFHQVSADSWKVRVKPPRLGGNKTLGVFATRSPLRPNPIGLSVVRLEAIRHEGGKLWLELSGIDLLDGTPVLDIKPYVPYVDAIPGAVNHFAETPPELTPVSFTDEALAFCRGYQQAHQLDLQALLEQVLQQDPRPRYQTPEPERRYGMKLLDLDVHWHYHPLRSGYRIHVSGIVRL
jgi:tRNA-Thr(GGU) m(6)t(6)A37 methyltransferase TsaA